MPDLSNASAILNATAFLYPSLEDAREGRAFGGSGVCVQVPLPNRPDLSIPFFVTNWHVAVSGGASVVRYVDKQGEVRFVDADPSEWTFLPAGPDLAALPLLVHFEKHPHAIPLTIFASDDEGDLFIGEDVFMCGRFIDYDGIETNKSALRFGAISMFDAPIRQQTGYSGHSVIVDMHSRTGFSGSPVYAYRENGRSEGSSIHFANSLTGGLAPISRRRWGTGTSTLIKLVGLQWGQFPEAWEVVKRPETRSRAEASLVEEGDKIAGFSGMSCVVPASEIVRLINCTELTAMRQKLVNDLGDQVPVAE